MEKKTSHLPQMIGSLLVALAIIAATISAVSARIGPGGIGDDDEEAREERRDEGSQGRGRGRGRD